MPDQTDSLPVSPTEDPPGMRGAAAAAPRKDEPYPPAAQAWATVIILVLLYITSLLDRNIIALMADNVRDDLQITDHQLGMLMGTAFGVSYALGALPLGWAMDRFSRRQVLWAGVTVWSLGTMACGLSRGFTSLFTARTFVGAGEAVLIPGNQSIITDMFPPDRLGVPFAVNSLGSKFGQGLSYVIGGFLIGVIAPSALFALPLVGDVRGWQLILIMVGFPGLLLALLVFTVPEPARRRLTTGTVKGIGYRHLLIHMRKHARFFLCFLVGAALATQIIACLMSWAPTHFIRAHNMSPDTVGIWLGAMIMIGPAIGMPIHGIIADRLFRRGIGDAHVRYLSVMMALSTIPFFAAFTVSNPWLGFVLLALGHTLYGSFGMLGPIGLQLMLPGELRGKGASTLLLTTSLLGISVGPSVLTYINDMLFGDPNKIGIALAIYIAVALPLGAFFYWLTLKPLAAFIAADR